MEATLKYRSKPVIIDAWPIREVVSRHSAGFAQPPHVAQAVNNNLLQIVLNGIHIQTLEGGMFGRMEDMLIMGTAGEFYPCKPEIFATKYEALE